MDKEPAIFVGVDWAIVEHQVCMVGLDSRIQNASQVCTDGHSLGLQLDQIAAQSVEKLKTFVSLARTLKAERGLASRRDTRFLIKAEDAQWEVVSANLAKITRMTGAGEIVRQDNVDGAPATVTPLGTLALDLAANLDVGAEKIRLAKELETLSKHIAATDARLNNKAFTDKAPAAVVEGARKQLAEQQAKRAEVERLLQALG